MGFATTNLVVEEGIPDIFCDSGHSLNITLTFLVALGADAVVKHVRILPDRPESTREEY